MGMRTNAVLTALNYILDDRLDRERKAREDKRKLQNIEQEMLLRDKITKQTDPLYELKLQYNQTDLTDKLKRQQKQSEIQDIQDEVAFAKARMAKDNLPFEEREFQLKRDLIEPKYKYEMSTLRNKQQQSDWDYEHFNEAQEAAKEKAQLASDIQKAQLGLINANTATAQARKNSIEKMDAIRKMYAENKINGGGREEIYKAKYDGLDPLRISSERTKVIIAMDKIRSELASLGEEDRLNAIIEYQMLQDEYEYLTKLKNGSSTSSNSSSGGLYNLVKGVGETIMNKIAPYNELINKGITNYENRKAEAVAKELENKKQKIQDRRFR